MAIEKVLFGTYTKRVSKGLYVADFDASQGVLENAHLLTNIGNPTYTIKGNDSTIYSVDKHEDDGGVAVINLATGVIQQEVLANGASPAYLGFDAQRQLLFSGNYHKGTVDVFSVGSDGQLTLKDSFKNEGSGPRDEQKSSHVHFTNLTPDQRLAVVDLGADEVLIFDVDVEGKLHLFSKFQTEKGFGPRHIRFSPDGKQAYLLGELSSQLSILDYADGQLSLKATLKTIPSDWHDHNGSAALRVSQDGRFVYASNRGHNSVAVFSVAEQPERIQVISTAGDFPRDMALSANDDYLIVANQNTDNVSVYRRDPETGQLELTQKDFKIPEGVRVEFI
ncbi:lactonase family protein [Weissella diestrammenae]|uniref:Lactonase family protein n=1 Tax=Weissella diestrammenae TaxID=1162633 RepID=A0A7G9T665_9LACO|nr:lactonase family protein [Weissella diestrammenae]MCM0583370.1 lactonase family protein [Weissella diestrammenae]QNN75590.1 lactonase family protein [Weissella diestrammenae]